MPCIEPLGMENGTITDSQIESSSDLSSKHQAAYGRLNLYVDGVTQGWVPKYYYSNFEWLLINLYRQTLITGIVMQGQFWGSLSQLALTKTYKVSTSLDNKHWEYVTYGNGAVEVRLMTFCYCHFFCLLFPLFRKFIFI